MFSNQDTRFEVYFGIGYLFSFRLDFLKQKKTKKNVFLGKIDNKSNKKSRLSKKYFKRMKVRATTSVLFFSQFFSTVPHLGKPPHPTLPWEKNLTVLIEWKA